MTEGYDDRQAEYELHRRSRRIGYAMDHILVGCSRLKEELEDNRLGQENEKAIAVMLDDLREINLMAKEIESLLLTMDDIYKPAIPRNVMKEDEE